MNINLSDPYTTARVAAGYLLGNPELKVTYSGKILEFPTKKTQETNTLLKELKQNTNT